MEIGDDSGVSEIDVVHGLVDVLQTPYKMLNLLLDLSLELCRAAVPIWGQNSDT